MIRAKGFTLIEILIALSVFAIVATLTSTVLFSSFNTRIRVNRHADRLVSLQLAISLLERDTEQTLVRAIRTNEMKLDPAFTGQSYYMEFTRSGMANPRSLEKQSTLQRVALVCLNHQLLRRSWESLDPVNKKIYEEKILLDNLSNCQFQYLNQTLQVLSEWRENAVSQAQKSEPMPKAIQISLGLNEWGKGSFLFPLPGANYANPQ